jgi:uncharacterized membrane protein YjjP (DUF1212 family)
MNNKLELIDKWCGALCSVLVQSADRTMTDEEIRQVIDIAGGLVSTLLQDAHRIADALEAMAKAQQIMTNVKD